MKCGMQSQTDNGTTIVVGQHRPRRMYHKVFQYAFTLMSIVLLALMLASCNKEDHKSVRGHVIDVQARSLTEVQSLIIQDNNGTIWTFRTAGDIEFTPSHIKEHMLLGQELSVYYADRNGHLIVLSVID